MKGGVISPLFNLAIQGTLYISVLKYFFNEIGFSVGNLKNMAIWLL